MAEAMIGVEVKTRTETPGFQTPTPLLLRPCSIVTKAVPKTLPRPRTLITSITMTANSSLAHESSDYKSWPTDLSAKKQWFIYFYDVSIEFQGLISSFTRSHQNPGVPRANPVRWGQKQQCQHLALGHCHLPVGTFLVFAKMSSIHLVSWCSFMTSTASLSQLWAFLKYGSSSLAVKSMFCVVAGPTCGESGHKGGSLCTGYSGLST